MGFHARKAELQGVAPRLRVRLVKALNWLGETVCRRHGTPNVTGRIDFLEALSDYP